MNWKDNLVPGNTIGVRIEGNTGITYRIEKVEKLLPGGKIKTVSGIFTDGKMISVSAPSTRTLTIIPDSRELREYLEKEILLSQIMAFFRKKSNEDLKDYINIIKESSEKS